VDTLFDLGNNPEFDRDELRERLESLASRGIRIGGSSWKYEGWIDQIYSRSRYLSRGRFSKKLFEETCLQEYASIFPTVSGDFAFYQFPPGAYWEKLFRQSPPGFKWGFKIPEQITVPVWPVHPRYGAAAGRENPDFLNRELFCRNFLKPLEPFREKVGVLIFEFGSSASQAFADIKGFIKALDRFLTGLPPGWRYAVEVRNAELLVAGYFNCLRAHNAAHVFNAWTRMPEIGEQLALPESVTSDMIVTRALLKRGRPYADAVREFSPYNRTCEVNTKVRDDLRKVVDVALVDGMPAYIFVNNRLEGNSPMTIEAVVS
jgi:uncharacterized protein YecE (DUF72 family)